MEIIMHITGDQLVLLVMTENEIMPKIRCRIAVALYSIVKTEMASQLSAPGLNYCS